MFKLGLSLAGILSAVLILSTIDKQESAYAISGCCKQRESIDEQWSNNEKSFKRCKLLNEKEDGKKDDLLQPKGTIWWDISC